MSDAGLTVLLERFAFEKVGEIALRDGYLKCNLSGPTSLDCGFVYLWIEVSGATMTVVYVGKAGGTLVERCKQHDAGFKRSSPGVAHAGRLRQGIGENKGYAISRAEVKRKKSLVSPGLSIGVR